MLICSSSSRRFHKHRHGSSPRKNETEVPTHTYKNWGGRAHGRVAHQVSGSAHTQTLYWEWGARVAHQVSHRSHVSGSTLKSPPSGPAPNHDLIGARLSINETISNLKKMCKAAPPPPRLSTHCKAATSLSPTQTRALHTPALH